MNVKDIVSGFALGFSVASVIWSQVLHITMEQDRIENECQINFALYGKSRILSTECAEFFDSIKVERK